MVRQIVVSYLPIMNALMRKYTIYDSIRYILSSSFSQNVTFIFGIKTSIEINKYVDTYINYSWSVQRYRIHLRLDYGIKFVRRAV